MINDRAVGNNESDTIVLFDIDGTLVPSGEIIKTEMIDILEELHGDGYILGLVGGGTYEKIKKQMDLAFFYFKYVFAECGAVIYVDGNLIHKKNMLDYVDRPLLNEILKKAFQMISEMPIIYHGCQTDFRHGLVYISPPGIQAGTFERNYFLEKDSLMGLRKKLLDELKKMDVHDTLEMSFGGAVGIAIHPKGWNKSQIVDFFKDQLKTFTIYFFGDKTEPDGNDYPLYSHEMIKGISVRDYHDTMNKIAQILL